MITIMHEMSLQERYWIRNGTRYETIGGDDTMYEMACYCYFKAALRRNGIGVG